MGNFSYFGSSVLNGQLCHAPLAFLSIWALTRLLGDFIIQNSSNFFVTLNQNPYQIKNVTLLLNNSIADKENHLKECKIFLNLTPKLCIRSIKFFFRLDLFRFCYIFHPYSCNEILTLLLSAFSSIFANITH